MSDTNDESFLDYRQEVKERIGNNEGTTKVRTKYKEECDRANLSNTKVGRTFKDEFMEQLVKQCSAAITMVRAKANPIGEGAVKKEALVNGIFEAWTKAFPIKGKAYDPAEILMHVALQAMLDQAGVDLNNNYQLLPNQRDPKIRPKLSKDKLEKWIGTECLFQLKCAFIKEAMGGIIDYFHREAGKDGANRYYHHLEMNDSLARYVSEVELSVEPSAAWYNTKLEAIVQRIQDIREHNKGVSDRAKHKEVPIALLQQLRLLNKVKLAENQFFSKEDRLPTEADLDEIRQKCLTKAIKDYRRSKKVMPLLQCFKFDDLLVKHLGAWVTGIVYNTTGLFEYRRELAYTAVKDDYGSDVLKRGKKQRVGKPDDFLYFTKKGIERESELLDNEARYTIVRLPMLMPPRATTREDIGGWLGDVGDAPQWSTKGFINLSDDHLRFYNHQANVAFKLNQFIYQIMATLMGGDSPTGLGSFKPYHKRDVVRAADRFGALDPNWQGLSHQERVDLVIARFGEEAYKVKKREANDEHIENQEKLTAGIASLTCFETARKLRKEERWYIPVRMDFRGRVVPRCNHFGYQQPDHGKALLLFADEMPVTDRESTCKWLLIQLANNYGNNCDKLSLLERQSEMQKPVVQAMIKAVATMNDDDGDFSLGMEALKRIDGQDGDCWQWAAAAHEYYYVCKLQTKKTTSLPVTVDASTSGQQIMAGWRKSSVLAQRTNCTPALEPADLYGSIWLLMLDKLENDDKGFTKENRTLLVEQGYGRKIIKAGFQGGQYGASTDTQLEGISEKIKKLKESGLLVLSDEEVKLFYLYYPKALKVLCDLETVNMWFSKIAGIIHAKGKKEILVPCPNGSTIHIRYPASKKRRVDSFGYGGTEYTVGVPPGAAEKPPRRQLSMVDVDATLDPNIKKWQTSLSPNTVHGAGDASLLSIALMDFQHPFTSCHDSVGTYAGVAMDNLRDAMRKAYVTVAQFEIFNRIVEANGLDIEKDEVPVFPLINDDDYDVMAVLKSNYFVS
jgi:DNA-dependent RNA polymerase